MNEITELAKAYEKGLEAYKKRIFKRDFTAEPDAPNILAHADNAPFMSWLSEKRGMKGKIDFIYADPPFFSKASYGSFDDIWKGGLEEFLEMMTLRLLLMRELLSGSAVIAVHMDWHAVHYVKVIMDEIFGRNNFVNELIWIYKSGGSGKKSFAKKHDNILLYSKSSDYYFKVQKEKSYNRGFKPYRFKGVEEFEDENGWYTLVNRKDVFSVNMVGRTSGERTGYRTQKPLELLSILLQSCSKEGALCADFFCGSGTLPMAAFALGRRFIACDSSLEAVRISKKRLQDAGADFSLILSEDRLL